MTTGGHILYSFRRCPYAMRARLALKIADIPYAHREVLLRDKPPEMLAVSPKGTVPVLVCADGRVIDESFDIMLWALEQNDPEGWLAPDMDEMMALISEIEGPFVQHLVRYKYASRFDTSQRRNHVNREERDKACVYLQPLEARLSQSAFVMGETVSLADQAIMPFIRQFAMVEPDWWSAPQFPALARWLSGLLHSDLFQSIMKKYPQWTGAAAPT